MLPNKLEAFHEQGERHILDPSILPDCMVPDFVSSSDVTTYVERAIAHQQVLWSFQTGALRSPGDYGNSAGLAAMVAEAGRNTIINSLDLFVTLTHGGGWGRVVEELAEEASEQHIDFAREHNL